MGIINSMASMGMSVLLPMVIVVLSLILGIKAGKAVKAGLMLGTGFVGVGLIINMMNSQLGPAVKAMSEQFGLNLSVVDIGWQGAATMAWSTGIAAMAIPVAVSVNVIMLGCRMTQTVNIDIWNIWHMVFTGAIAYTLTGKIWIGIVGIAVHGVVAYKLGDLWAPFVEEYFELERLTIPHGTSAYMAPIACVVDAVIEKIPGVNKIDFSADTFQEKAGIFAEPVVMGAVFGTIIGVLAGYSMKDALPLGIEISAVMVLMPKIVKCIMEGLLPISERIKEILAQKFAGTQIYIGLDPSVLLGDTQVMAAGLIFVPVTLLIAVMVPGNRVLPFGDLATISFFIAISVAVHRGNLFRTLISGSIIIYITIWIANQTIPWMTALAAATGTTKGEHLIAAMDQGGSPITYIYTELFIRDNIVGLITIGVGYIACILFSIRYSKKRVS